ncbi:MAG: hypothetical protein AB1814_04515 [Thermodesulfobacteriota bacterium]
MDKVEGIWDQSWQRMLGKLDSLWNGLLDKALDNVFKGAANIFNDAILQPAWGWLSSNVMPETNILGSLKSGAAELASSLGLTKLASWMGGGSGGITNAMANSASMFDFGSATSLFGATGGAGGTFTPTFSMMADLGLGGGIEAGGAAAGLSTLALPMAMAVGPGLIGSLVGPMLAERWTPEEAQDYMQGQLDFAQRLNDGMQELGRTFADLSPSMGLFSASAQDTAHWLDALRETAGYTNQQLDAMIAATGPLGEQFIMSGQAADTLSGQVRGLAQEISAAQNNFTITDMSLADFNQRIDELANRLGLGQDETTAFRDTVFDLAEAFSAGGLEAEAFDQRLQAFVQGTLSGVAEGAGSSTAAIRELIAAMAGVEGGSIEAPKLRMGQTAGQADVFYAAPAVDALGNALPLYHAGGVVDPWRGARRYHAGDMVSALARDEVPIIARRGEYVVRAESVGPATLPLLRAINAGALAAAPAMNLHLEIHGNLLGSEDNLEDLARLIEGRLRSLQASRWSA